MLQGIGTATSLPRALLMPAATRSQASALRLETTTFAPCSASRWTIASPMPLVEPVTSATFPLKSNKSISLSVMAVGDILNPRTLWRQMGGNSRVSRKKGVVQNAKNDDVRLGLSGARGVCEPAAVALRLRSAPAATIAAVQYASLYAPATTAVGRSAGAHREAHRRGRADRAKGGGLYRQR